MQELSLTGESDRALSAVGRWRKRGTEALVVVDQFEELFALSGKEVQSRFAAFLGRLAEEAGAHVLLSLRDDFLFCCSEHDGLRPVFQDLTPLTPPSPDALRRAVAEPARREGCRFEEDEIVEEMVEAVAAERGALPLLAFAVSRLWAVRDRERKVLTREAYGRMGGVAGALAQHAEATLSQLGEEREVLVREIFRNVVTAQGTRAVADRAELLSVFGERTEEAGAVLDALVDARLLTQYEPAGAEGGEAAAGHRRVEIVHESLLTHWPRLARWRTRDADGAQLRDQLRQAAHLWDERGRRDDLLWRGASYLDYRAWRARHIGGLSALEGEFGQAMTALAAETPPAHRRRGARGRASHRPGRRRRPLGAERSRAAADGCRGPPGRVRQVARPGPGRAGEGSHRRSRLRDEEPRAGRHRGGSTPRPSGAAGWADAAHGGHGPGKHGSRGDHQASRGGLQPERGMVRRDRRSGNPALPPRRRNGRDH